MISEHSAHLAISCKLKARSYIHDGIPYTGDMAVVERDRNQQKTWKGGRCCVLASWDWYKMTANLQTTFSNAFLMKIIVVWFQCYWDLFKRVQEQHAIFGSYNGLVQMRRQVNLWINEDLPRWVNNITSDVIRITSKTFTGTIELQFIDAWHQIWKPRKIYFWMQNIHLCVGFLFAIHVLCIGN